MVVDKNSKICRDVKVFGNVSVGSKGQIVIPSDVRKQLDITPGDSLIIIVKHGKAIGLVKSTDLEGFIEMVQEELKKIND